MTTGTCGLLLLGLLTAADLAVATHIAATIAPRVSRGSDGTVRSPLAWLLLTMIRIYRTACSGRTTGVCRFEPSCSAYGLEAVRRYGGVRGGLLTAYRLLRCQPMSVGGYDPVPTRNVVPTRDPGSGRAPKHPHKPTASHPGTRASRGTRV
ncbi:membrane protein insertion efficiency factor YidD [Frankia sp. CiP3]|uniref:membrane protein insertion efficiency factor YidD n=1 Tax=Frankia sp. CiP3 TaxID=2880971 RepID=UPI001EF3D80D|nr:membrane protein insertion efficiency factor YidD [Frankia sp. CiP3]